MPDLDNLSENIKSGAHDDIPVSYLCKQGQTKGKYTFPVFKEAQILIPMLEKFKILTTTHKNKVFDNAWNMVARKISSSRITFQVFIEEIWSPVYQWCESLLLRIKDKSISLEEIEQFEEYEVAVFRTQLITLSNGFIKLGSDKLEEGNDWLEHFITDIGQYRLMKQYQRTAILFSNLKESFGLTGDFTTASKLMPVVCFSIHHKMFNTM